jgi:hypothetical protein
MDVWAFIVMNAFIMNDDCSAREKGRQPTFHIRVYHPKVKFGSDCNLIK